MTTRRERRIQEMEAAQSLSDTLYAADLQLLAIKLRNRAVDAKRAEIQEANETCEREGHVFYGHYCNRCGF